MRNETHLQKVTGPSYHFTTVDVPNSVFTTVLRINGNGEAVGTYRAPNISDHIFAYENGTYVTIDFPGTEGTGGVPNASINDAGVIAGNYYDNGMGYGFTYSNGTFVTIDVPGATYTTVTGINNAGELTGYFSGESGASVFVYNNGTFTTIPSGIFPAINSRGEVVGEYLSIGSVQGFIYKDGVLSTFSAPAASSTIATAVNDLGVVAGNYVGDDGISYGFIDRNGSFTTIGMPGSNIDVTGIDNHGDVVGSYTDSSGHTQGFIDIEGKITTVDVPGSVDTSILGINARGQLVGTFDDSSGNELGFIADPCALPSPARQPDLSDLLEAFGRHSSIHDFSFGPPPDRNSFAHGGVYAVDRAWGSGGAGPLTFVGDHIMLAPHTGAL